MKKERIMNIEQGMINDEVKEHNFYIHYSLFIIQYLTFGKPETGQEPSDH
jgi:hypothetical protein